MEVHNQLKLPLQFIYMHTFDFYAHEYYFIGLHKMTVDMVTFCGVKIFMYHIFHIF